MTDDEIRKRVRSRFADSMLPPHISTGPVTVGAFRGPCAVCGDRFAEIRHGELAFHDRYREIWLEEANRRG